jgi:uncharacterized membrane protein YjjP (DUF1212 family)
LSLLHQVYRKVVRDEISASQGCRVLRRIERQVSHLNYMRTGADGQTIPYPVWVLILVAAVASATASRVAFAGSFVDILMSGVLGSILAIVQFTIAGRHRLLSNIFEIGMAGILAFFAVCPLCLNRITADRIARTRQYGLLLLPVCGLCFYRPHSSWVAYLPRST